MRLERHPDNPIFKGSEEEPTWERTVFNWNVIKDSNGIYHALYRAITSGYSPLGDKKGFADYTSSIGLADGQDGIHFTNRRGLIEPTEAYEISMGCEDPRVTRIGDTCYIFYTAVKGDRQTGHSVRVALATTDTTFQNVQKHGIIGPNVRSKAATLFPRRFPDGNYKLLFTWRADSPQSSIVVADFANLERLLHPSKEYWSDWYQNFEGRLVFAPPHGAYRGAEVGAPPIEIKEGWLTILCPPSYRREWSIAAALLDKNDPRKVLGVTPRPILSPEKPYEIDGDVRNVAFPSGAVLEGDRLRVYYGSADSGCCMAEGSLKEILNSLSDYDADNWPKK